jgi:hypothetical protein
MTVEGSEGVRMLGGFGGDAPTAGGCLAAMGALLPPERSYFLAILGLVAGGLRSGPLLPPLHP